MASRTVSWDAQDIVVRIGGTHEICVMAGVTIGWSTGISVFMALQTIDANMRAGEREVGGVMIKSHIGLPGRVACQAGNIIVNISIHANVSFIRFRVDVAGYAADVA